MTVRLIEACRYEYSRDKFLLICPAGRGEGGGGICNLTRRSFFFIRNFSRKLAEKPPRSRRTALDLLCRKKVT